MLKKILIAFIHPLRTLAALRRSWRHRVTKVLKNGETWYRYKGKLYPAYLNNGNAASGISAKALEYCFGNGIDVGAGDWPLQGAIPVREEPQQNAYKLDNFPDGSLDFVFSSHCLEHLDCWPEALALWARKLKPGGVMFLYLPHESMGLWRPGAPWVKGYHKWIPTSEAVCNLLQGDELEIAERGPEPDEFWGFYVVARKRAAWL